MAKVLFVICVPARLPDEKLATDIKSELEKEEDIIDDKTSNKSNESEEEKAEEAEEGAAENLVDHGSEVDVTSNADPVDKGWDFDEDEEKKSSWGKKMKDKLASKVENLSLKPLGITKHAGDTSNLKSDVPGMEGQPEESKDEQQSGKTKSDNVSLKDMIVTIPETASEIADKKEGNKEQKKAAGIKQDQSGIEDKNKASAKTNKQHDKNGTDDKKGTTTELKQDKNGIDDKNIKTDLKQDKNGKEGNKGTEKHGDKAESQKAEDDDDGGKSAEEEKVKRKESGVDFDDEYVHFLNEDWTLIEKVKAALDALRVTGVHWSISEDHIYVGMFIAGDGERCEEILHRLSYLKIGVITKSSISVFPASISIASIPEEQQVEKLKQMIEKEDKLAEKVSEFKKSIKSRLVVAQVVDSVKSDAMFTFDYLMLIVLASLVALMGLLEASSVTLVASMLISPLMGPILAGVFGAVIRNRDLLKVGIRSELMGLGLCIFVGFITGFVPSAIESAGLDWRSVDSWPTVEMSSRGALRSIPVGILIAIPSGAGVALSILGGKVGSLVGVAISASLLPPAVNAGLLWANAIVVAVTPPKTVAEWKYSNTTGTNGTDAQSPGVISRIFYNNTSCPPLIDNEYVPYYYCDMAKESAVLGVMSLLLTILNIVCIIIMGIVVLKVKEVAPIRSVPPAEKDFFGKDLKIARGSYETTKGQDCVVLGKKFLQEYTTLKKQLDLDDDEETNANQCNALIEEVEDDPLVRGINQGLPRQPHRCFSTIETSPGFAGADNYYNTYHVGSSDAELVRDSKRSSFSGSSSTPEHKDKQPRRRNSHYVAYHRSPASPDPFFGPLRTNRFFARQGRFKVEKVVEEEEPEVPVRSSTKVKFKSVTPRPETQPLLDNSTTKV